MLSLSNVLSFLRAPLALLFLIENVYVRLCAIVLAMISDSIDGYLARRWHSASSFGAVLDPVMDKFFVLFVLIVLFIEGKLGISSFLLMLSRDFFLCAFGFYLVVTGLWKIYVFRAVRWGKVTTALQFFVLMGLTLGYSFPSYLFYVFFLFGFLAFWELCLDLRFLKDRS